MSAQGSLFHHVRRATADWLIGWYWRTFVVPERCPCSWPIKSKRLMHLCGRMDDAYDRLQFRDFGNYWSNRTFPISTVTTTAGSNVTVTWTNPPRKRHGDKG